MFVGEWKNGKYHGHGTFSYPDRTRCEWEHKYVGDCKKGEKHGQGTYYFSCGGELVGEFKENKPWNVTEYDKDTNIIQKVVNGVWQ